MTRATHDNLAHAFIGEAKAYFRLRAFAEQADKEGYHQVAALFRAVALAESIHAEKHFALLEKVGNTEQNLKYSFEKETFVNEVAYPEFLRQAWADEDREAIWAFTAARNAEERHARLYKAMLTHMVAERDVIYFVCTNCGWVEDGTCPDQCPNCGRASDSFARVV